MLGFNHTLAGSIIAVITPAPLVPLVAFVSHFLFDMTPHFGRHPKIYPYTSSFKKLLVLDAVLCFSALAFAVILFPDKWLIIAIGAFFSTLPDFMWIVKGKVSFLNTFFHWAEVIQWGERPYGWIFDVTYAMGFTLILWYLSTTNFSL